MPDIAAKPNHARGKAGVKSEDRHSVPVDEQPILQKLFQFRHDFSKLRHHTRNTLTLNDLNNKADELALIMFNLRAVRESNPNAERNRIDEVLDTIWTMLFYTWGKISRIDEELYPVYEQLALILRRCVEMDQSGAFTADDVNHLKERVLEIETKFMRNGAFVNPERPPAPCSGTIGSELPTGQAIMMSTLNKIHRRIGHLDNLTEDIDPQLMPIHDRLVTISKHLSHLAAHEDCTLSDITPLEHEVQMIDADRVDGAFVVPGQPVNMVLPGQGALKNLFHKVSEQVYNLMIRFEPIDKDLAPIYESLRSLMTDLMTQSDSSLVLNDSDVDTYLDRLFDIGLAKDGNVFVPTGRKQEEMEKARGQSVLQYLMERCQSLVHEIICRAAGTRMEG
ncbi:hypothetical protein SpCBS45565_g03315 [Spizellomyces sp. 'palustris']|nr:hypothetical protein SpCBS45565_g03315 [Spizellomyces sp. 'palustris']